MSVNTALDNKQLEKGDGKLTSNSNTQPLESNVNAPQKKVANEGVKI